MLSLIELKLLDYVLKVYRKSIKINIEVEKPIRTVIFILLTLSFGKHIVFILYLTQKSNFIKKSKLQ
jgi:hypothetical protein